LELLGDEIIYNSLTLHRSLSFFLCGWNLMIESISGVYLGLLLSLLEKNISQKLRFSATAFSH
jgi:hypothetical protein